MFIEMPKSLKKIITSVGICFSVSFPSYSMGREGDVDHGRAIQRFTASIAQLQRQLESSQSEKDRVRTADLMEQCYMQKAAHHYHVGDNTSQVACYKAIMGTPFLSDLSKARAHVNIAVVHLRQKEGLLAAGHAKKAAALTSMDALKGVVGSDVYGVFAKSYFAGFEVLFKQLPAQALPYLLQASVVPHQGNHWYGMTNLLLAVGYDQLLDPPLSLKHAKLSLVCTCLTADELSRALAFAAIASEGTDNPNECLRYFREIKHIQRIAPTERYLLYAAVAKACFKRGAIKNSFKYTRMGLESLDPASPQYLFVKHNLAIGHGAHGRPDVEEELYEEILEAIATHETDKGWESCIREIRMSIETVLFEKALHERLDRARERQEEARGRELEEQRREREAEKERRKEKKKEAHKKRVEALKELQRNAAEQEQRRQEQRLQEREEEKARAERRKELLQHPPQHLTPIPSATKPEPYIAPERPKEKVKTRGESSQPSTGVLAEEKEETENPVYIELPDLSRTAQIVLDQIEDEDWTFTREDYSHYLEALHCTRRETGGSHRVFQLPKALTLSVSRGKDSVEEHIYLPDEDIQLGSVTLPAWTGRHVPLYLRKQLRTFHAKILTLYSRLEKKKSSGERGKKQSS